MHDPLSALEFPTALRHGHGRAFRYVQQHGLKAVADDVLEACLKNQAYDPQCESSRAPWLYSMFKGTPEHDRFSAAIRSALAAATDSYDLHQLCELCLLMAQDGDGAAGAALRARVLGQPFGDADLFGCHALVVLDGMPAVVELARRFGNLLLADPDEMLPTLGALTDGLDILPLAETKLGELAETDSAIRAFLDKEHSEAKRHQSGPKLTKEQRLEQIREHVRNEYPFAQMLADASAGAGDFPSRYMRFGKYAEAEELREVLQRLVAETDEKTLLRLLWVFRRAELPDLHPRIWELSESKNDAIREAATEALAQICDPRVGELGRAKLRSPDFSGNDSEVLDLFIRNFQPQDEAVIMSAVGRLSLNDDNAHEFGYSILKMCEENDSSAFAEMIRWVYETTPCTIGRHHAVEWMANRGVISPAIASECLYDADEDTQEIGQQAKLIRR